MKNIVCVTDNCVEQGSTYWGEHGLSFLIQTENGCLLFDTGRSDAVFWHNLALLGKSLTDISALVLSHAHLDHTGALVALLSHKPGLPVYAHPDLLRPRYAFKEDKYKLIGPPVTEERLSQLAEQHLSSVPVELLPGIWTSGEITERDEPEGRSSNHVVKGDAGWRPDPYRDDMSLVMETQHGSVVICGCCHAGLLNTLAHIRRTFARPIIAVVGGTHLVSAADDKLKRIIQVLRQTYHSPQLYLNHCTGQQAYVELASAFGNRVSPCPAGRTLQFD